MTPYKIGIFGVSNEAAGKQTNYIIPEAVVSGKGPNAIASMLHHYLQNYSLGESVLYVHADNCVGQNKNNVIMHYLCWRILAGLNKYIRIMFLPVGHTKFAPDGGFGLIKSKFRRSLVCTATDLCECIQNSTPVSKMNQAVLVGTESGTVHVLTYNWQKMFQEMQMKPIVQIKKQHHFTFSSVTPGGVSVKTSEEAVEAFYSIVHDPQPVDASQLPEIIHPQGLSAERQWYLFESIRPLVPEVAKDVICPEPHVDRRTFAETRAEAAVLEKQSKKVAVKKDQAQEQMPVTPVKTKRTMKKKLQGN